MVNYLHYLKLLPLLILLVSCLAQEEHQLEALHRNKRTLTTICVEIKPSGPQEEPYFMCKGTDISRGGANASPPPPPPQPAAQPPPQTPEQQQPMQNYAPPAGQMIPMSVQYAQTPFQSFPSFGAGFFPIMPSYEESPKPAPPSQTSQTSQTSYQSQAPAAAGTGSNESPATNYGSAAAPFAPASPAQSYGLPAVPYPATGGTQPTNRGTAVGPSATATPNSYADAAPPKSSSNAHKSQPAAANGNAYDALLGSRHRMPPAEDVMNMPDVGFRHEELRRTMEPMVGVAPPPSMMWTPLAQAQFQQPPLPPYYDDPVMRTFYASQQDQYEPQVAQAAPMEQLVSQAAPAYAPAYANAPSQQAPQQLPQQQQQPVPVSYAENPKYNPAQSLPADSCTSCSRSCSSFDSYNAPAPAHCPSFQPVIIAMPCYGQQQQPTHYLAVPGSGAQAPQREQLVGSAFGGPFSMAGHGMGSPFGMNQHFGMSAPQVGSGYGMGPQVGAPFGMAPVLNPFGPFGHLNPFNPFNRILGAAAASTTQQPRLRLFGASEEATTAAMGAVTGTATSPATPLFPKAFTLNFASSTVAPPTKPSTESSDVSVGASSNPDDAKKSVEDVEDDDGDDDDEGEGEEEQEQENENNSEEVSAPPQSLGITKFDPAAPRDPDIIESLENKNLSAGQLLDKGVNKLTKADKRKRHNSRNSNASSQKRKYLQRL